jgi:hypothetical protein
VQSLLRLEKKSKADRPFSRGTTLHPYGDGALAFGPSMTTTAAIPASDGRIPAHRARRLQSIPRRSEDRWLRRRPNLMSSPGSHATLRWRTLGSATDPLSFSRLESRPVLTGSRPGTGSSNPSPSSGESCKRSVPQRWSPRPSFSGCRGIMRAAGQLLRALRRATACGHSTRRGFGMRREGSGKTANSERPVVPQSGQTIY